MEIEKKNEERSFQDNTFVGVNGDSTGLGFVARDILAREQEKAGNIEFTVITNNGDLDQMKKLIDVKNIFSRQLPKMPREYIVKLVFDRNHETMIIIKGDNTVLGGICFRMYPSCKFAEIAFLAITGVEQVKGFGTRLMNKFKELMQKRQIEFLMTYADNFAINFFKKQGFHKEIQMPPERWKGYIKDYDGGTLMECKIHQTIDYNNIGSMIKEQRIFVTNLVKSLTLNNRKFPGLDINNTNNLSQNSRITDTKFPIEEIPGINLSRWCEEEYKELKKPKEKSLQTKLQSALDLLTKHKSAWPFTEPVQAEQVPDYHTIIKKPIDFSTIRANLYKYKTKEQFEADVMRIFSNAKEYNKEDTVYYKAAVDMEKDAIEILNELMEGGDEETKNNIAEKESVNKSIKKSVKKKSKYVK